jgi:alanyl-tRNA synthetase
VEADYFRFDFSHPKGVSAEELQAVEAEVNAVIAQKSDVETKLMTPDEAVEEGAMALFGEKYGDEVRVLSMGSGLADEKSYSVELCGGTHVANTADIEVFKITRETSVAAGVRRIEGRTAAGVAAFEQVQKDVAAEDAKRKAAAEEAKKATAGAVAGAADAFAAGIDSAEIVGDITFYGFAEEGISPKDLRGLVDQFNAKVDKGVVVIVASNDGKVGIVVGVTGSLTGDVSAVDLVRVGSAVLGGKGGGGRPDFAQAGGDDPSKAQDAIAVIKATLA